MGVGGGLTNHVINFNMGAQDHNLLSILKQNMTRKLLIESHHQGLLPSHPEKVALIVKHFSLGPLDGFAKLVEELAQTCQVSVCVFPFFFGLLSRHKCLSQTMLMDDHTQLWLKQVRHMYHVWGVAFLPVWISHCVTAKGFLRTQAGQDDWFTKI